MKKHWLIAGAVVVVLGVVLAATVYRAVQQAHQVKVGSKAFTESVVLGEVVAGLIRSTGQEAYHEREMGGTQVLWKALLRGSIDVYPEYTGTISEELLHGVGKDENAIRQALEEQGVRMTRSLGFANTFALGMREQEAARLGVRTISDLQKHRGLTYGFSNEFLNRKDGWPGLKAAYRLDPPPGKVSGMDHELAYRSIAAGSSDVTDLYSTDANIRKYDMRVLADDRKYFPDYQAVLLYRADLADRHPEVVAALLKLEGQIDPDTMMDLNYRVNEKQASDTRAAADFLAEKLSLEVPVHEESALALFWRTTWEHLQLVTISLLAAIVVALPLGILASKQPAVGQVILGVVGIIQTIPSLAVLVFMIPLLGVGTWPAVVALFLYSLLPIVRNTFTGLKDISPSMHESALVLGLPASARLWLVELPMASRSILAGIKTAAVINVGTATIGALIGAGGYGQPILTGIRLNDVGLILQGAIPAAALALIVQGLFELAERTLVSRGLRLSMAG
jgi:osmoprotectant transport system permease protein